MMYNYNFWYEPRDKWKGSVMASEAKIAANRRNAARSTGPKTGPGKAIASLNALKTGTYAKTSSLMPGEDREAYGEIEEQVYAQMMPVGAIEEECVRSIIEDLWKLGRLRRLEAVITSRHMTDYCMDQYNKLSMIPARDHILDKLFSDEADPKPKTVIEDQVYGTFSDFVQDKMRHRLGESEETSKSKDTHGAGLAEDFFNGISDNNLIFEAHRKSTNNGDFDRLSRQRQDVMRDLQKNYAFLDTLQHRRQTVEGHVTTVVVSNDTGSSG